MARNRRRPPVQDPLQELTLLAQDLDLTGLVDRLPDLLNEAESKNIAYTEFALRMLRTEKGIRLERSIDRGYKRARLGVVEDLDGFDFSIRPKLEPRIIRELSTCRFIEEKRNILMLGRPGLGKTRIAKYIAREACRAGHSVLFVVTAEMLEDLQSSLVDGTYKRTFRRYTKPTLLVCDEFAYEPLDQEATKHLFRLVSARHKVGSIILTSNTGFSGWKKLFPSAPAAHSTVDRLVDHATILRFSGQTSRPPKDVYGAPLEDD